MTLPHEFVQLGLSNTRSFDAHLYFADSRAAVSMTAATACGCDTYTAWLPLTSTAVEPACLDIIRWASGGTIMSSVLITYQLGFVYQAGSVIALLSASTPHDT